MASPTSSAKLDLRTICDVLGGIEHKWFKIGVQLGIPRDKLQQFKKEDDPLSAVIDYWLRGNVPEKESPISWEFIAKALRSRYIGEPGLAEEISRDFCQQEESTCEVGKDCAKATPDTVPIIPASENSHHQENKDTGESLSAISPQKKFLPQEITSTQPSSPKSQPQERKNSSQEENKSPPEESKMDPKVKEDLEFILQRNLREIMVKYASYVDCLRMAIIKDKKVSAEDLRSYLLSLPAVMSKPFFPKPGLLSDKKSELQKCDTVTDIFNLLTTECASFLNYGIFQDILTHYDIRDDQEKLKYPEHLKAYTEKHKISEFAKINPLLKSKSGCREVVVKYDIEITCSLAKVIDLKVFITEIMDLNPSALEIVDIEDGCVIVTFLIPASVADVFNSAYLEKLNYRKIKDKLILWVKFAGYKIAKRTIEVNWVTEASKPRGIAVNQNGEVIVTECVVHCVTVLSPSGEKLRSFGTRGSGEGQFEYPYGVAVDSEDNILVADCGNHRIQKFTAEGKFLAAVGSQDSGPLQFDLPSAITVSASNGRVYVANGNETITILNPDFSHYRTFGHKYLKKANQIASDRKGNIYVASSTGFIEVFSDEGKYLRYLRKTEGKRRIRHSRYQHLRLREDVDINISTVAITHNDRVVVGYDFFVEKGIDFEMVKSTIKILSIFSSEGQLIQAITRDSMDQQYEYQSKTEFSGLVVDHAYNIYMCDYFNNKIVCYSLKYYIH